MNRARGRTGSLLIVVARVRGQDGADTRRHQDRLWTKRSAQLGDFDPGANHARDTVRLSQQSEAQRLLARCCVDTDGLQVRTIERGEHGDGE